MPHCEIIHLGSRAFQNALISTTIRTTASGQENNVTGGEEEDPVAPTAFIEIETSYQP